MTLNEDEIEAVWDRAVADVEAERVAAGSRPRRTFRSEDEYLTHLAAECSEQGDNSEFTDAVLGLARIFGPPGGYQTPEPTKPATRLEQIERLNRSELNQACLKHLPSEWRSDGDLHVLSLIWWGLEELPYQQRGDAPYLGELEATLTSLARGDQKWALDWLTKQDGSELVTAEQVENRSRQEAAQLLVGLLLEQMQCAEGSRSD